MQDSATIRLPASLDSLPSALAFVSSHAERLGFDRQRRHEIEISLEEVFVNIVHHAYQRKGGNVEISCRGSREEGLHLEVIDWGMPFDILSVEDPDISLDISERDVGGLGIFFMKQFMNNVGYRREGERNILSLLARMESPASDEPGFPQNSPDNG